MCRKQTMQACCLICGGLGVLIGYAIDSWWLSNCTGIGLVIFGLLLMKRH